MRGCSGIIAANIRNPPASVRTRLDSPPGAEVAARKYLPRFSYGKFTMFEVMSARWTYGAKTVMVAG